MGWFTEFYWDWGFFIYMVIFFGMGYFVGYMHQKEKYGRLLRSAMKLHDAVESAINELP